jgi:hypothetical protein
VDKAGQNFLLQGNTSIKNGNQITTIQARENTGSNRKVERPYDYLLRTKIWGHGGPQIVCNIPDQGATPSHTFIVGIRVVYD